MKVLNHADIRTIHCIGIGGIGVSGLAEILHKKGYVVTGSDVASNPNIERLTQMGIKVAIGHKAENIGHAQAIIYTSIIHPDNPEWLAAKNLQLPCVSRGEMLAEIMQSYTSVAVAGTHGKTTTTGMIIHTMLQSQQDFSYFMGGILKNLNSTVGFGKGSYFVSESDESDASFLYMQPNIAVVTNIDADHLETYAGSFERLQAAFLEFLNRIPNGGLALLGSDNEIVRKMAPLVKQNKFTFGFEKNADYRVDHCRQEGLRSFFQVHCPDLNEPIDVELNAAGRHNILNALPAIIIARKLQIADAIWMKALATFPGVRRRFSCHGEIRANQGKALLFEDYGHHPNEIKATMDMAKGTWPDRRLVLVFQPHRYTRTRDLMIEFAQVLSSVDVLILMEVYAAGETKIDGADTKTLSNAVQKLGASEPHYVAELDQLPEILKKIVKADDIIVFQGAGNIGPYAQTVAKNLS